MFLLQALQFNGTWYTVETCATKWQAEELMYSRGGFRRNAVKYRIVRG